MKKKNYHNGERGEKEKGFDTPVKHKNQEQYKYSKVNTSKTPERRDQSRKEERSKSTNQKLVKRKNAKSM